MPPHPEPTEEQPSESTDEPIPPPVDAKRQLTLGIERESRGDLRGAIQAFKAIAPNSEFGPEASFRTAKALLELGDSKGAEEAYAQAGAMGRIVGGEGARYGLLAGMALGAIYEAQEPVKARTYYERVAAAGDPELSPQAALEVGRLFLKMGDPRQAEDALRQAVETGDRKTADWATLLLGDAFREQNQVNEAERAYVRALESETFEVQEIARKSILDMGRIPPTSSGDHPLPGYHAIDDAYDEAVVQTEPGGDPSGDYPTDEAPETRQTDAAIDEMPVDEVASADAPTDQGPIEVESVPTGAADQPGGEVLPAPPTPGLVTAVDRDPPQLIGRLFELESMVQFLHASRTPEMGAAVIVLTGPLQSGKGTLAAHVARETAQRFPDGAWVVRLPPDLSDFGEAQLAVAAALGQAASTPATDPGRAYADALSACSALIVLEEPPNASVAEIFRPPSPSSALLVTSWDRLPVVGSLPIELYPLSDADLLAFLRQQAALNGTTLDDATEKQILSQAYDVMTIALLGDLLRSFPVERSMKAVEGLATHRAAINIPDVDAEDLERRFESLAPASQADLLALGLIPRTPFDTQSAAVALGDHVYGTRRRLRPLIEGRFLERSDDDAYALPSTVSYLAGRRIATASGPIEPTLLRASRRLLRSLTREDVAPRSGYVTDMVRKGKDLQDHLDMKREVDALSWVVTAEDAHPPLSIGLFGVWGSGKSTFMELMQAKIEAISREAYEEHAQRRYHPACGSVRQITFNAWHYADANLWASLVTHIFDELAKPVGTPNLSAQEKHQNLLDRLETSRALRIDAEQKRNLATRERLRRMEELADVKHERLQTTAEAERGDVGLNVMTPTQDLRLQATDAAKCLSDAGVPLASDRVSKEDVETAIGELLADPDLLRRAVAALPDREASRRLDALLAEPAIRDLLTSTDPDSSRRKALVAVLTDPGAQAAAKDLIPDDDARAAVTGLGEALTEAYREVLQLRAVKDDLGSLWGKIRHLWRKGTRNTRALVLVASAAAVIAGVAAIGLVVLAILGRALPWESLAATLGLAISTAAYVRHRVQGPLSQINEAVTIAVEAVDRKARRRIEQLEAQEAELQSEIDSARREEHEAEREIEDIRLGRRLQSYIEERARASDYRSQLGIVAQVRKDFMRLADLMQEARDFRDLPLSKQLGPDDLARKAELETLPEIDRVILYIDDLDRCPTDRVVQVLEAVHLLLALPLFVVVVGVDPRWLMQSLKHHYAVQLRGSGSRAEDRPGSSPEDRTFWESTPQNYLEKIFQIPFTIRGMNQAGYRRLIDTMFPSPMAAKVASPQDDAPAPQADAAAPAPATDTSRAAPRRARPSEAPATTPATGQPTTTAGGDGIAAAITGGPPGAPKDKGAESAATPTAGSEPAPARVEVPPGALAIAPEELAFLHALANFVPTPRAARRLANTYRLVRVLLRPSEDAIFGAQSGEQYKVVLTLLAMLVGFPEQATVVFEEVVDSRLRDWSSFKEEVIDAHGWSQSHESTDRGPASTDGLDNGRNGHTADARVGSESVADLGGGTRDEAWERLSEALRLLDEATGLPANLEDYQTWAVKVSRYSFHTGRLAATIAEVEMGSSALAAPAATAQPVHV